MPNSPPYSALCLACGSKLARVRRNAADAAEGAPQAALRRYRCTSANCGWEGLLPRRGRRSRRMVRRRLWRDLRTLAVPVLALAGIGAAMAAVAWQAGLFTPRGVPAYARGQQYDGVPLPARHPLARHHARAEVQALSAPVSVAAPPTLALRHSCVWGKPGGNPYRGSVEQALRSAALPEEVIQSVVAQVRAGQAVDRLEIRNDGVRALGSGRVYNAQNIAMTYGETLCLGTRVNFVEGHMEPAALYEAATANGRVVAVMVPEVCGNVSVLGQSDTAAQKLTFSGAAGEQASAVRWMPAVLDSDRAGASAPLHASGAQDVPEPGTLACVLTALGVMGLLRHARQLHKRRSGGARPPVSDRAEGSPVRRWPDASDGRAWTSSANSSR